MCIATVNGCKNKGIYKNKIINKYYNKYTKDMGFYSIGLVSICCYNA
jgi:hypothetical protein